MNVYDIAVCIFTGSLTVTAFSGLLANIVCAVYFKHKLRYHQQLLDKMIEKGEPRNGTAF